MAQIQTVPDDIQEQIHFDTLWEHVLWVLQTYSGKLWANRTEHDPGITLLQAFSYLISDVGYRHTLPLVDLLTPDPTSRLEPDNGVFSAEFGADRALTCGPVTFADYRRAMLDLNTLVGSGVNLDSYRFCFLDVQLIPASLRDRYRYRYDATTLTFHFSKQPDVSDYVMSGEYELRAFKHPDVPKDVAQSVLESFFRDNRNLCEMLAKTTWLVPELVEPALEIVVEDDCILDDIPMLMARAVRAVEGWLNPPTVRYTDSDIAQTTPERLFDGPKLVHGWIKDLPESSRPLEQENLIEALLDIEGIQQATLVSPTVLSDDSPFALAWRKLDGEPDQQHYVRDYDAILEKIVLLKRGQRFGIGKASNNDDQRALRDQLEQLDSVDWKRASSVESIRPIAWGKYRALNQYRSAGSFLPACYGLQQIWSDHSAGPVGGGVASGYSVYQLMAFLLPFEQMVADRCALLANTGRLLSFDHRAGDDWAYPTSESTSPLIWNEGKLPAYARDDRTTEIVREDEPSEKNAANIFSKQREGLTAQVNKSARDAEKELAIVNYLLGYFGTSRTDRVLLPVKPDVFRRVQQGFLRQITTLTYNRASIDIRYASALHRRIAARLGIGPALFRNETFDQIDHDIDADGRNGAPFYVIEHRELLPVAPAFEDLWHDFLPITKVSYSPEEQMVTLDLSGDNAKNLKVGQIIDLQSPAASSNDTSQPLPIVANVIHSVTAQADKVTVTIDLKHHDRLRRSVKQLLSDYIASKLWQWRLSPIWLNRKRYPFAYTTDSGDLPPDTPKPGKNQKWLWVKSLPSTLVPSTTITLIWSREDPNDPPQLYTAKVIYIDPKTRFVLVDAGNLIWPTESAGLNSPHFWSWAVPYNSDAFALSVSVVLPRDWLSANEIGDVLKVDAWVRQVVAEEVPSHLSFEIHWLDADDFTVFRQTYDRWQIDGRPKGDLSYALLDLLSIGGAPVDRREGVGVMHIATDAEKAELERLTHPLKRRDLTERLIFHVPITEDQP